MEEMGLLVSVLLAMVGYVYIPLLFRNQLNDNWVKRLFELPKIQNPT